MKEYFEKVKSKLKLGFIVSWVAFFVVLIILFLVMIMTKPDFESPSWLLLTLYTTVFSFLLSAVIMLIGFISSYTEFNKKVRIFKKSPLNQLDKIGFRYVQILQNSWWVMYEVAFVAIKNNFIIAIDSRKKGEVTFYLLIRPTNKKLSLDGIDSRINLRYTFTGIEFDIPLESVRTPSVNEIDIILSELISRCEEAGIPPHSSLERYENEIVSRQQSRALSVGYSHQ